MAGQRAHRLRRVTEIPDADEAVRAARGDHMRRVRMRRGVAQRMFVTATRSDDGRIPCARIEAMKCAVAGAGDEQPKRRKVHRQRGRLALERQHGKRRLAARRIP